MMGPYIRSNPLPIGEDFFDKREREGKYYINTRI